MFSTKYLSKLMRSSLSMLSVIVVPIAFAQVPAQYPLLNTSGGGVPPNLMLTMDDSGSMAFKHMPEATFAGGTFATVNPVGTRTVRWDPTDNYMFGINPSGTVLGNRTSTNYVLRALRSPDTNTIFYNPEIRYQPWAVSTFPLPAATGSSPAGRMENSPPTAAFLDPVNPVTGGVINLTSYSFTAVPGSPGGSGTWCYFDTTFPPSVAPSTPPVISIRLLVTGLRYTIIDRGSSDFRTVGADNNRNGVRFVATGFGNATSGTGTAQADTPPMTSCALRANSDPLVVNHDPGVYFRLQTQSVTAGSFVGNATAGTTYTITTVGTTDFTLIGARSNTVGVSFTASGPGVGTGTATGYKAVNVHTNYDAKSINVGGSFPKVEARTDCSTGAVGPTGCTQAEERQNFANWYSYYRNRNLLARGAMMEAFAVVGNTLRIGFGRLHKSAALVDGVSTPVIESSATYGGGGVRPFNQTRKDELFSWLRALPASGGTPLPAAMVAVGEYYSRADVQGPYTDIPGSANDINTNKTCRRSYHLMMTDGYWNGLPSVGEQDSTVGPTITEPGTAPFIFPADTRPYAHGVANTLADVAMKYWKNDLQPGMANKVRGSSADPSFWQNMTNYMVGLGVKGALDPENDLPAMTLGTKPWGTPDPVNAVPANIDDLWHAALNSRGSYFSAKDPASLAAGVSSALIGAQGGSGATAGVATVSSVLQNGNKKYVPRYDGNVWSGDIDALPLGANGQAGTAVWSAAARMPAWASRNIYTWDTSPTPGAVPFLWPSLSSTNQAAMSSGSLDLVNFLRGDDSNEVSLINPLRPFRARRTATNAHFILGDIVNSNPVLIKGLYDGAYGGLGLGGTSGTYQIFTAAKTARDGVLFVGANDGMLHAFKDVNTAASGSTDGAEVFAYVPRAVYGNLSKLSDKTYGSVVPHQFFVDGAQREYDAFVTGPAYPAFNGMPACAAGAACWRNFLVGSLGAGGKTVYALDVTSSPTLNASNIRWELSDVDLGYVMAPIQIGVLPSGKWVAIFGNGYSSTSGKATLFVVDIETAAVTKLDVDTSGNGLGGVALVKNANGVIQSLYAGDLKGKLWRFDYNTPSVPFAVTGGTPLFTATDSFGAAQPITQPPAIFDHSLGGKILVIGTGSLFSEADAASTSPQTIYGVWDKRPDTVPRPISTSLLQSRALTTQVISGTSFYTLTGALVDWTIHRGWKVDVTPVLTGGRIVYPPVVFTSKLVLVTAVAPAQSAAVCDSNFGVGADFVFNVEDGLQATHSLFDTNGDGLINSSDIQVGGVLTNSVGIRAVVTGVSGNTGGLGGGSGVGQICQANYHPISIQTSTGQSLVCVPDDINLSNRPFDRVQRRIINPPIR